MNITITIADTKVVDLLDSAGSNYWCAGLAWPKYHDARVESAGGCWSALMADQISFVEVLDAEDEDKQGRPRRKRVTREGIRVGFELMAQMNPRTLGRALSEHNWDASTGDVLLQLCAFGEVRYA